MLNNEKLKGQPILLLAITLSLFLFTSCQRGSASNTQESHSFVTAAPGSPIPIPDGPGPVVIGDVNNDKKLDLVVALSKTKASLFCWAKVMDNFPHQLPRRKSLTVQEKWHSGM